MRPLRHDNGSCPLIISPLIIDGHVDTAQRFLDERWQFTDTVGLGHLSLDAARAGGLRSAFFAIWAEPTAWQGHFAHRCLALIDAVLEQARVHPEQMSLCISPEEIVTAHRSGRFAVLMGIEGGHAIEEDLALLRTYFRLGARYMTLTWSNSNAWADSSGDLDDPNVVHHGGLTAFGRAVVCEMNRLGMMVDVSHVSDPTFDDVLATTRVPVIASHSSARALTAAPRNLTDDMLRVLAANGGVAMVNFFPAFIDESWRTAWNAQRPEREAARAVLREKAKTGELPVTFTQSNALDREFARRLPRAPLSSLIDHLDHVARVAGMAHVGIGTDFDGMPALPAEIDSAADLGKVVEALRHRGYDSRELAMLLGGNLLRVFTDVSRQANDTANPPYESLPLTNGD